MEKKDTLTPETWENELDGFRKMGQNYWKRILQKCFQSGLENKTRLGEGLKNHIMPKKRVIWGPTSFMSGIK